MEKIKLDFMNYYSDEANRQYMSYSQYKDFLVCEAMAMAKLWGGWSEPKNEAFLLGSYVHAWSEGPEMLEEFKKTNPELFLTRDSTSGKKGDLKSTFKIADVIIETLKNDDLCRHALTGQKEVLVTADFGGCTWKGKLDVYNPERGWFTDLKVVKSLHDKFWIDEVHRYGNFIENYGYVGQFAIYSELERLTSGRSNRLEAVMVAVTKEDPPDKVVLTFTEDELRYELEKIEFNLPRILQVKNREVEPVRCESCRFCRETKTVTKVIHWSELEIY